MVRLRAGTVVTTVLMATHVGFNLAPQVDTCEMSWPKFRGLGQKDFSKQQIPGGRRLLDRGSGCGCEELVPLCRALCQSPPGQGTRQRHMEWLLAGGCPTDEPFVGIGTCGWAQHPSSQVSIQVGTQSPPQKAGSRLCSLDVQCVEWGKSPQLSPVHLRPAFSVPS